MLHPNEEKGPRRYKQGNRDLVPVVFGNSMVTSRLRFNTFHQTGADLLYFKCPELLTAVRGQPLAWAVGLRSGQREIPPANARNRTPSLLPLKAF